jgi:hypothetical protein
MKSEMKLANEQVYDLIVALARAESREIGQLFGEQLAPRRPARKSVLL